MIRSITSKERLLRGPQSVQLAPALERVLPVGVSLLRVSTQGQSQRQKGLKDH